MLSIKHTPAYGHLAAGITILIWGTTLVSTKTLLVAFQPVEILFFRFLLGYFALLALCPRFLRGVPLRHEVYLMAAGLCGICLYYLLENIALVYSLASNVSIILSTAPFFTALLSKLFFKHEPGFRPRFFVGFLFAMVGIALVVCNGAALALNPLGDFLALLAAFFWASYSVLIKKIGEFRYPTILVTRRIFFYGLLSMIPALFLFDFRLELSRFSNLSFLMHILFLGLCASALCFITWNTAVECLGPVKTASYIYAVPGITLLSSAIFLNETITFLAILGMAFTLIGLLFSNGGSKRAREHGASST